jgi:hypothetical protein
MVVKTRSSGRVKAVRVTPDLIALEAIYEAAVQAYLQGAIGTKHDQVDATPKNVGVPSSIRNSKQ